MTHEQTLCSANSEIVWLVRGEFRTRDIGDDLHEILSALPNSELSLIQRGFEASNLRSGKITRRICGGGFENSIAALGLIATYAHPAAGDDFNSDITNKG